jgi:hypothetical protein
MSTSLIDFQRTIAGALMLSLTRESSLRRSGNEAAVSLVKPNAQLTSFERLEIYARSYWSRLLDAFGEDFSGLRAVLGAEAFDRMRRQYLAECPSESFTLRNLGRRLPAWLCEHPEFGGALALEMAQFEWAEIESFDAASLPPLSAEQIAEFTEESRLRLQPHLQLVQATNEVDTLLLAVREHQKAGRKARRFTAAHLKAAQSAEPLFLAIHRPELVVHYKRLDREMFLLLQALGSGATLAQAIEAAYSSSALDEAHLPQHIQQSFSLFTALGWFTAPVEQERQ